MSTTLWERVKTGSKAGFDKTWQALDKVGAPVNKLSNKLGAEAFWPTTLDKECDKAARILKSFCKDGFTAEEEYRPAEGPKQTQKVIKKIPASVIRKAKGLAIFTTMRTGLYMSGAGGSGILIARKDDGTWSPPSGILLHTAGLGFMIGIDIYDCVVVINTERALEAFYKVRCTLGSEISVAAGPVGAGGVLETELHKRQAPVFTYMKSRGFYAGVQIDGTIIIERGDENERFYGQRMPVKDILSGKVRHPPFEIRRLMETLKAAQGDVTFDASALPSEPPPSDYEVNSQQVFGVPAKEDPDPYGVLALEKEGMRIVEAGTQNRASWEQFSFNPSPTSPVHTYSRNSASTELSFSRRDSWRSSYPSTRPTSARKSIDASKLSMIDTSTQTDSTASPILTWNNGLERHGSRASTAPSYRRMRDSPEAELPSDSVPRKTPLSQMPYSTPPSTPPSEHADSPRSWKAEPTPPEQPSIEEHASTSVLTVNPVMAKARLVDVPKRVPPQLPPRNPDRHTTADPAPSDQQNLSQIVKTDLPPRDLDRQNAANPALSDQKDLNQIIEASQEPALHPVSNATSTIPDEISEQFNPEPLDEHNFVLQNEPAIAEETRLSSDSQHSSTWAKVRALRETDD